MDRTKLALISILILAALGFYVQHLHSKINDLEEDVTKKTVQITMQNDAIEDLHKRSDKAQADLKMAQADLAEKSKPVIQVLKETVKAPNTCADARPDVNKILNALKALE